MRRCKRQVSGRMPVLRQNHVGEQLCKPVDRGNDGIAIRDCQSPAGTEIVLHVHDDENVGCADSDRGCHGSGLRCSLGPQEFRDRILREVPKWKDVIAKAHIKAE